MMSASKAIYAAPPVDGGHQIVATTASLQAVDSAGVLASASLTAAPPVLSPNDTIVQNVLPPSLEASPIGYRVDAGLARPRGGSLAQTLDSLKSHVEALPPEERRALLVAVFPTGEIDNDQRQTAKPGRLFTTQSMDARAGADGVRNALFEAILEHAGDKKVAAAHIGTVLRPLLEQERQHLAGFLPDTQGIRDIFTKGRDCAVERVLYLSKWKSHDDRVACLKAFESLLGAESAEFAHLKRVAELFPNDRLTSPQERRGVARALSNIRRSTDGGDVSDALVASVERAFKPLSSPSSPKDPTSHVPAGGDPAPAGTVVRIAPDTKPVSERLTTFVVPPQDPATSVTGAILEASVTSLPLDPAQSSAMVEVRIKRLTDPTTSPPIIEELKFTVDATTYNRDQDAQMTVRQRLLDELARTAGRSYETDPQSGSSVDFGAIIARAADLGAIASITAKDSRLVFTEPVYLDGVRFVGCKDLTVIGVQTPEQVAAGDFPVNMTGAALTKCSGNIKFQGVNLTDLTITQLKPGGVGTLHFDTCQLRGVAVRGRCTVDMLVMHDCCLGDKADFYNLAVTKEIANLNAPEGSGDLRSRFGGLIFVNGPGVVFGPGWDLKQAKNDFSAVSVNSLPQKLLFAPGEALLAEFVSDSAQIARITKPHEEWSSVREFELRDGSRYAFTFQEVDSSGTVVITSVSGAIGSNDPELLWQRGAGTQIEIEALDALIRRLHRSAKGDRDYVPRGRNNDKGRSGSGSTDGASRRGQRRRSAA